MTGDTVGRDIEKLPENVWKCVHRHTRLDSLERWFDLWAIWVSIYLYEILSEYHRKNMLISVFGVFSHVPCALMTIQNAPENIQTMRSKLGFVLWSILRLHLELSNHAHPWQGHSSSSRANYDFCHAVTRRTSLLANTNNWIQTITLMVQDHRSI